MASIIIPVKNCSAYLDECFQSIVDQKWNQEKKKEGEDETPWTIEISIFDDGSTVSVAQSTLIWWTVIGIQNKNRIYSK